MKEHGQGPLRCAPNRPLHFPTPRRLLRCMIFRSNSFYFMELKTIACLGNARIWPTSPL
jgi:hypothetical protein